MERRLNANYGKNNNSLMTNLKPLLLPMATAIGAFGGFPEPPQMFKSLASNVIFQYAILFVLIWQGGGGQNMMLSLKATVAVFIILTALKLLNSKETFKDNCPDIKKSLCLKDNSIPGCEKC